MFGKKPVKRTSYEIGADVVKEISDLVGIFEEKRVSPLMEALCEVFGKSISESIEDNGINADLIRAVFVDLEQAWIAANLEMMGELLNFRNMQEWLEVCDAVGMHGQIIDWIEEKFEGYKTELWLRASAMIGGRVLSYGLDEDGRSTL